MTNLYNKSAILVNFFRKENEYGNVASISRHFNVSRKYVYDLAERAKVAFGDPRNNPLTKQIKVLIAENEVLRQDVESLKAELSRLKEIIQKEIEVTKDKVKQFIILASIFVNSLRQIKKLVKQAFGVKISRSTIQRIVEETSCKAKDLMEKYFANASKESSLDEIFIGRQPLLVSVCPKSLALLWTLLAKDRKGTTWEEFLRKSPGLELVSSDMGSGVVKGIEEASLIHQADLFHLKNLCNKALTSFENYCYRLIKKEYDALDRLKRKKSTGKGIHKEAHAYSKAKARATKEIEKFDLAESTIKKELYPAFEIIDTDGNINTYHKAKERIDKCITTLSGLKFKKVKSIINYLKNESLLTFLKILELRLRKVEIKDSIFTKEEVINHVARSWYQNKVNYSKKKAIPEVSNERRSILSVKDLLKEKIFQESLERYDEIKSEIVNILDAVLRSSSAVECVNSIIRPYQQIKKRFSKNFIYLVSLYHNLHKFVKGSKREGKSPAEILGVKLPTYDFFELLKTV